MEGNSMSPKVQLSSYERAINVLNQLSSEQAKIISEALEDLREERDHMKKILEAFEDGAWDMDDFVLVSDLGMPKLRERMRRTLMQVHKRRGKAWDADKRQTGGG
jgi:type II secretory pathway predicted ATPase ExeA